MGTPPLTTSDMPVPPFNDHPAMGLLYKDELDDDELEIIVNSMHNGSSVVAKKIKEAVLKTESSLRSTLGQSVASGDFKDELNELRSIGIPPALVLGEKDELIHAEYVKIIAEATGWQNKPHIIPSVGHSVQLEAPKVVNNLIVKYISFINSNEN